MTAIYPGSYDPVTWGHLDILGRAARLTDRLIVAILHNMVKPPFFSLQDRIAQLTALTRDFPNVEIDAFSGLLVDYAQQRSADLIIRGVRSAADFEYERPMLIANRQMTGDLETVLLVADPRFAHVSAGLVREIATQGYGGRDTKYFNDDVLDNMVPPLVKQALRQKFSEQNQ